jgi:hypothetical protein
MKYLFNGFLVILFSVNFVHYNYSEIIDHPGNLQSGLIDPEANRFQ